MQYLRRRLIPIVIGGILVLGMLWVQFGGHSFLVEPRQRLELLSFDARLNLVSGFGSVNDLAKVIIVDIDERSLREHGRWPWSRTKVAELVECLTTAGAAVIAFDVMFSEPEPNPATEVAATLREQGGEEPRAGRGAWPIRATL